MLENGFAEIDGVEPGKRKGSPSPQKETISTNINAKGASSGPGSKPNSQQKKNRIGVTGAKDIDSKC
jgi:hypothetical protein